MADGLKAHIDVLPAEPVAVGGGVAIAVSGSVFLGRTRLRDVEVLIGTAVGRACLTRLPRPEAAQLCSGFVAIVPLTAVTHAQDVPVVVRARVRGRGRFEAQVGTLRLVPSPEGEAAAPRDATRPPEVAICMATFDPDPELFAIQIASIRAQTLADWRCWISDDGSSPESVTMIRRTIGHDERFILTPASERRGVLRNFERALSCVPDGARYVAYADQDDRWEPHKLEALRAALDADPGAQLAYCDCRVVDRAGTVLAPSFWTRRCNQHRHLTTLALANTVTGAACLFRADLAGALLPFPRSDESHHDAWTALIAAAHGRLAYVPEPLFDYVQHSANAIGHDASGSGAGTLLATEPGIALREHVLLRARYLALPLLVRVLVQAQTAQLRTRHTSPVRRRAALWLLSGLGTRAASTWWLAARALTRGRSAPALGLERDLLVLLLWRRVIGRLAARTPEALRAPVYAAARVPRDG
ncbi:unannotated protein [freshwater metagenome]|uniref:Unannotated protein n=1 Tax=freshwater metagenome TaxID=449393 RepID=A0A6J7JAK4_9ZZZZ|nr:glycosyltransferase [Actinomycetota bacterium]